jgi:hypothetical protein
VPGAYATIVAPAGDGSGKSTTQAVLELLSGKRWPSDGGWTTRDTGSDGVIFPHVPRVTICAG